MVKYSFETKSACDNCCEQLSVLNYRRISETEIEFRQRPTLRVKRVLGRFGAYRDDLVKPQPVTAEQVWGLAEKFNG